MTEEGKAKLIEHEGEVLNVYPDSKGFYTIGIGHLVDPRRGGRIKRKISRIIFDDDLADVRAAATVHLPWFRDLDEVRQDVVEMLIFNMGVGDDDPNTKIEGLKSFVQMIAAIKAKDWHKAAFELANSEWGRTVQKERKIDLCNALEKGAWG